MNENNNTRLQELLTEIGLLQEELKNTQLDLNDTRQRLALEVGRNAELFQTTRNWNSRCNGSNEKSTD